MYGQTSRRTDYFIYQNGIIQSNFETRKQWSFERIRVFEKSYKLGNGSTCWHNS